MNTQYSEEPMYKPQYFGTNFPKIDCTLLAHIPVINTAPLDFWLEVRWSHLKRSWFTWVTGRWDRRGEVCTSSGDEVLCPWVCSSSCGMSAALFVEYLNVLWERRPNRRSKVSVRNNSWLRRCVHFRKGYSNRGRSCNDLLQPASCLAISFWASLLKSMNRVVHDPIGQPCRWLNGFSLR